MRFSSGTGTTQEQDGINALVLDIKSNLGGTFHSVVEISSIFVERGEVATRIVGGKNVVLAFKTE